MMPATVSYTHLGCSVDVLDLDLKRCPIDERRGVISIQQIAELCRAARRLREVARDAVAGHAQRNGTCLLYTSL